MRQRLAGTLVSVAVLFAATRVLAQESVEVLDEKEGEVEATNDSDDDGGWDEGGDGEWEEEGSSESGAHFGLRTGWGIPMGKVAGTATTTTGGTTTTVSGGDLSDGILGQIPIWLDLGWQATPPFMLGMYFSYGFVLLDKNTCPDGSSCSANDIRLGLQVQYSFGPHKPVDFWLGGGLGYEWFSVKQDGNRGTLRGFELLMLQLGVDFGGDSGSSSFGPFAAFTFGRFDKASSSQTSQTADIDPTAFHNWLFIGLHGAMK